MKPSHEKRCPHCRKKAPWERNPYRPFCSERCRLLDLGQWASGSYRIPGQPVDDGELMDALEEAEEKRSSGGGSENGDSA